MTDGSAVNGSSAPATSTLTDVHVAPTVTAGGTATFTGGGPAVVLDAGLLVNDVDSGGNPDQVRRSRSAPASWPATAHLNFTNANGITGSYTVQPTGVLTLSSAPRRWRNIERRCNRSPTASPRPMADPTAAGTDTTRTTHQLGGERRQCGQRLERAGDHAHARRMSTWPRPSRPKAAPRPSPAAARRWCSMPASW